MKSYVLLKDARNLISVPKNMQLRAIPILQSKNEDIPLPEGF